MGPSYAATLYLALAVLPGTAETAGHGPRPQATAANHPVVFPFKYRNDGPHVYRTYDDFERRCFAFIYDVVGSDSRATTSEFLTARVAANCTAGEHALCRDFAADLFAATQSKQVKDRNPANQSSQTFRQWCSRLYVTEEQKLKNYNSSANAKVPKHSHSVASKTQPKGRKTAVKKSPHEAKSGKTVDAKSPSTAMDIDNVLQKYRRLAKKDQKLVEGARTAAGSVGDARDLLKDVVDEISSTKSRRLNFTDKLRNARSHAAEDKAQSVIDKNEAALGTTRSDAASLLAVQDDADVHARHIRGTAFVA